MGLFDFGSQVSKVAVRTAILPVSIAKDVVTMGGALTDEPEPATSDQLKKLLRDIISQGALINKEREMKTSDSKVPDVMPMSFSYGSMASLRDQLAMAALTGILTAHHQGRFGCSVGLRVCRCYAQNQR